MKGPGIFEVHGEGVSGDREEWNLEAREREGLTDLEALRFSRLRRRALRHEGKEKTIRGIPGEAGLYYQGN